MTTPMTLEDRIRDLAERGELNHISITGGGKMFTASFAPCSTFGITHSGDPDPIKALLGALDNTKLKRRSTANMKPGDVRAETLEQHELVTADDYDPAA